MNKKSELKLMESTLTIFFITGMLAIAMIFAYNIYSGYKSNEIDQLRQEEAYKTALNVISLPELTCTNAGKVVNNCIDIDKVGIISANQDDYFDYFGFANISIVTIYPIPIGNNENIVYERKQPNEVTAKASVIPIKIYNSTANNVRGQYSFGYLLIKNYYEN